MTQFYLPLKEMVVPGSVVRLEAGEAQHARDVFRLKEGDPIRLFDGKGSAAAGRITAATKSALEVRIETRLPSEPSPRVSLELAQALVPGETMDQIVRQAAELGVSRIWPLACERSIVRLDADKRLTKLEHWKKTVLAACKQCDRNTLPEVMPVLTPRDLAARFGEYAAVLAASPQDPEDGLALSAGQAPSRALLLIGPEGDFSPAEIALFRQAGARVVSLGPLILKSDTAAAAALAILGHLSRA
jgi:16S rRNA (uracil1498-N3)-methyltransferase